jgi:antitoxin FitA
MSLCDRKLRDEPLDIDSIASIDYIAIMAVLTIRNLPDEIRTRLRVRASKNGRSMEAEARAIIAGAVNSPSPDDRAGAITRLQDLIALSGKKTKSRPKGPPRSDSVDAFLRDRRRDAIREAIEDGRHPREIFRGDYPRIAAEAGWTIEHIDQLFKKNSPA